LLTALGPTGRLEVATLYADDRPVAAYLSFREAARLLLYNSGYDPRYGDYSAGFALLVYRIRQAIEEGVQTFDFLRGDERYKYDLGAQDQFIYRVIIRK
jgi:CelD/BcsL family acetyltransferase involved in cellulose biosynthesis